MKINVKREEVGDCIVIRLDGAPDIGTAARLATEAARLVSETRVKKLVFDFEKLTRIDCRTIGALVRIYRVCSKSGITMRITNVDRRVMHILELTQVAGILGASVRDAYARSAGSVRMFSRRSLGERAESLLPLLLPVVLTAMTLVPLRQEPQRQKQGVPESELRLPVAYFIGVELNDTAAIIMRGEVEHIFKDAGIPVREISLPELAAHRKLSCSPLFRVIIRDADPGDWNLPGNVLGVTFAYHQLPGSVHLFYREILRTLGIPHAQARDPRYDEFVGRALARVAVHELVHVLAPDLRHTLSGIMGHQQDTHSLTTKTLPLHPSSSEAAQQGWQRVRTRCRVQAR